MGKKTNTILDTLNIRPEESLSVGLLILQSIFLGIFYGSYDISIHTLFLHSFDASMISKAYAISGIVGILFTATYTRLQSKLSFVRLSVLNLFFISLSIGLVWLGFELTDLDLFSIGSLHFTTISLVIFIAFVLLGPLNILAIVGFWGVVGRLFSLRQGKRLFGMLGAGQVFGVILTSFSIPIIPILLGKEFITKDLLLISALSVFLSLIVQLFISRLFTEPNKEEAVSEQKEPTSLLQHLRNPYIRIMSAFVVLSMIIAFFIMYSFLGVTKLRYPSENEMATFLGVFTGVMMIIGFLIKAFLYSKIMKYYGLKVSLFILPILLIILTVTASLTGSFVDFEARPLSSGFQFFFLIIAMTRLFSMSLRDAIELPAFKTLYQSLDLSIRYDVQAKLDGTVNEFAALFSGLLLLALGLFSFIELLHYSYFLLFILLAWGGTVFMLDKEYKKSLQLSLAKNESTESSTENISTENKLEGRIMQKGISDEISLHRAFALDIISPLTCFQKLGEWVHSPSDKVRSYAVYTIEKRNPFLYQEILKKQLESEQNIVIKNHLEKLVTANQELMKTPFTMERISQLTKSRIIEERIWVAQVIGYYQNEAHIPQLMILLRDISPLVVKASLRTAILFRAGIFAPLFSELLPAMKYRYLAHAALIDLGNDALDSLEHLYNRSGIGLDIQVLIIHMYGEIRGERVIELLLNKLNNPHREIIESSLKGLAACNFSSTDKHIRVFQRLIERYAEIITWNNVAILVLDESFDEPFLGNTIQEELQGNYTTLYRILSLMYDPKSIAQVRNNLESGTNEGVGFAMELLDMFVSEELKPILFPLLDDLSIPERLKSMEAYFPVDKPTLEQLLNDILNRDKNFIGNWAKAVVLQAMLNISPLNITQGVIAHLFNPHKLLQQNAGILLYKKQPDTLDKSWPRIPESIRDEIKNTLELYETKTSHLLFEKVLFLKQTHIFGNLTYEKLIQIAAYLTEKSYSTNELVWPYKNERPGLYITMVGELGLFIEGELYSTATDATPLWPLVRENMEEDYQIKSLQNTVVYSLSRDRFHSLLLYNENVLEFVLEAIPYKQLTYK